MPSIVAVLDKEMTKVPTKPQLDGFKDMNIKNICSCEFRNDADNDCAHFVSHAMGFAFGYTCKSMTGKGKMGASIRVHEVFAMCGAVGAWADRTKTSGLVFVTSSKYVDVAKKTMINVPKKHIGIYLDNSIWHYSNTQHKVVVQMPDAFAHHYTGKDIAMFFGTFPK